MGMSIWHLLLILVVVFVVFGAGKLPRVMGDMGKGIRSLRDGMREDTTENTRQVTRNNDQAPPAA